MTGKSGLSKELIFHKRWTEHKGDNAPISKNVVCNERWSFDGGFYKSLTTKYNALGTILLASK